MPNGDSQAQETLFNAYKIIRARRESYAQLPLERQKSLYGAFFDRFAAPSILKSGVKGADLEEAKNRWIEAMSTGQTAKALSSEFGTEKQPRTYGTELAAEAAGAEAGFAGSIKNFLRWLDKGATPQQRQLFGGTTPTGRIADILGEGERKEYELAHEVSPHAAEVGAGFGKTVPSLLAWETGVSAIPSVSAKAPKVAKILSEAGKVAAGTAASTVTEEGDITASEVAKRTSVNIILDAMLRGGSKQALGIVNRLRTSKSATHAAVGNTLEDLLGTVLKDKYPGKTVDQLSPEQFDSLVKESQARNAAKQAQQKAAAKAVSEAEKAAKPKPQTPEEKAASAAVAKEKKAQERKAAAEASKAVTQRFAQYKRLFGNLPQEGTPQFEALKTGKGAEELLKAPEAKAVEAAKKAESDVRVANLAEGSPQAVDALSEAQRFAGYREDISKTVTEMIERRRATGVLPPEGERRKTPFTYKDIPELVKQTTSAGALETGAFADVRAKAEEKAAKAALEVESGKVPVKEKIAKAKAEKKSDIFKTDITGILNASSPEEFAKAKKEAMASVVTKAKELWKEGKITKEQLLEETRKEQERIRGIKVPTDFSKKTLDAQRKAQEKAGSAGSVPIETISAQENISRPGDDPELEMLRDTMLSQIDDLNAKAGEKVRAAIEGKDIKTQNAMIERAIVALKGMKKAK